MEKRPRIVPALSVEDKVFEILGWISLVLIWDLTFYYFKDLPDIIPIHYNGGGIADGYGSKGNIFMLPVIATILFVGMTILNRFPHIFNYAARISADNALRHYTAATRLIRYLKLFVVLLFGFIVFRTILVAAGYSHGLFSHL